MRAESPFQVYLGCLGHKLSYACPIHLSCPCLAYILPHPSIPLLFLLSLSLSICLSLLCLPSFPCPVPKSIYPSIYPLSYPSIHFSVPLTVPSFPLTCPSSQHHLYPSPVSSPQHPSLSFTPLLTPWSASLLARERLGVMWPRRNPTGLGSWLWSAAPEVVMSLRAITSPTSLGLLQRKGGGEVTVSLSPITHLGPPRSPGSLHATPPVSPKPGTSCQPLTHPRPFSCKGQT